MTKKKKSRRASLKSFAKGKFQSPVHSNGFKQDILIDLHGGDVGLDSESTANTAAVKADAAGKSLFKYQGTIYKVVATGRGPQALFADRTGKVH